MSQLAAADPNSLQLVSMNIGQGGFGKSDLPPDAEQLAAVQKLINEEHCETDFAVGLIDARRWTTTYSEAEIADLLGAKEAASVLLEDERVEKLVGPGSSIIIATDRHIQQRKELGLWTRQGLSVVLDVGKHGLQLAGVYFDDLQDDLRVLQQEALFDEQLEHGIPTVLIVDANSFRPDMKGASLTTRAKDLAVRGLSAALTVVTLGRTIKGNEPPAGIYNKVTYLAESLRGMNDRTIVPGFLDQGYVDADADKKRPTYPSAFPVAGGDYWFHTPDVTVNNLDVVRTGNQFGHCALSGVVST